MKVADCIQDINKINLLVDRYRNDAVNASTVCFNSTDVTDLFELLYNYKNILLQLQVNNILTGDI